MSPVSFPTGPSEKTNRSTAGHPTRASHCVCDRPLRIRGVDECLKCGKTPKDEIASTWTNRAREIASRNRAIAAKHAARKNRKRGRR